MKKLFKTRCPECFKARSTDVRAEIIDLLAGNGEKTVSEIVGHFKLKQPTISYHLSELESTGLVTSRNNGRFVYYKLSSHCPADREHCLLLN